MPAPEWRYAGHPYLIGEIKAWRVTTSPRLALRPFGWRDGDVDPKEHYWESRMSR